LINNTGPKLEERQQEVRQEPIEADEVEYRIPSAVELKRRTKKLEKKAQKEARAAFIAAQEEKKSRERFQLEENQLERKEKHLQEEEKQREKAEEMRREEDAVYSKWKDSFQVLAKGEIANTKVSLGSQITELAKQKRFLTLEEISNKFDVNTKEARTSIQELVSNGTLTGIFDDQGKFIYITEDELDQLASQLNERGRFEATTVARICNVIF